MDRNQLTGLMLMFLLLMLYFQLFSPTPTPTEQQKNQQAQIQTGKRLATQAATQRTRWKDSLKAAQDLGELAKYAQGTEQTFTLENESMQVQLSSAGGKIQSLTLKKYKTFEGKPLTLITPQNNYMGLEVKSASNKTLNLYQLHYEGAQPGKTTGAGGKVIFTLKLSDNERVEHHYTLPAKGYMLQYEVKVVGMNKYLNTKQTAELRWANDMPQVDEDMFQARYYSTINYQTRSNGWNYLSYTDSPESLELNERIYWVSFKQRFFSLAIIAPQQNIVRASILKNLDPDNAQTVKSVQAKLAINAADLENGSAKFDFFFGPNNYDLLRASNIENFDKNVSLGWAFFAFIAKNAIIPIFGILEGITSNYGLVVILLVLIIKVILFPLAYRSYIAMAKLKVVNDLIKPELDAFKEKNNLTGKSQFQLSQEEQTKLQQEQMRLYGELGTSPFAAMSGCVPLLLQMPISIALFLLFPNAIQLRQESFLWAHDLSAADAILKLPFTIPSFGAHISLFALLMTASTLAVTYYQSQSQAQMDPTMKYMQYIMPVVLLFVLNSYPAALNLCYLVQNVVSIGQQLAIRQFLVDENKIRQKFQDYKVKAKDQPKKAKSKFMQMLDEAQQKAREQAEAQKRKQEEKKGKKS